MGQGLSLSFSLSLHPSFLPPSPANNPSCKARRLVLLNVRHYSVSFTLFLHIINYTGKNELHGIIFIHIHKEIDILKYSMTLQFGYSYDY